MKWTVKKQPKGKIDGLDAHPMVHTLLLQRGVKDASRADQFLHPNYDRDLHDPFLFTQMPKLIARFKKAQENNEHVGIFGDHDVDGISGATILAEACVELGLTCDVYIPDKHTEGHGINVRAIDQFADAGATLMISVDCGSTSVDEVAYANKKNIDTIIIDHHNTPEVLPDAHVIINPKLPNAGYPFDGLCGTGTAFKVITALYRELLPQKVDQLKWLLDIVGIGTVADVMSLTDENRTIVKYGLLVLSKTRRIGYQEMIRVGRMPIDEDRLPDTQTIAFHIAPRINAAGRMAHARDAYELLIETDRDRAHTRAQDLEEKNKQRRALSDKIVKKVSLIVQKDHKDSDAIIIADKEYPVGIIGIIAGRIAHLYATPTGIFHKRDNGELQGSFRGVEGVSLVESLHQCSDLLVKFGGHDFAAGATIKNKNFDAFVQRFGEVIATQRTNKNAMQTIEADSALDPTTVDFALVEALEKFAPFGEGNAQPLFLLRGMMVMDKRLVGKTGKHVKFSVRLHTDHPQLFDMIGFGSVGQCEEIDVNDTIDVLCHIEMNVWNGSRAIQLKLVDIRKVVA